MDADQKAFLSRRIEEAGFGLFIKNYFPHKKIQKITLSGGIHVCPNRDPATGLVGCTYCNNAAFSPNFQSKGLPISEQLKRGIDFFRHKYPQMGYLAYFQSYTSTFGSYDHLIAQYEEVLSHPDVYGLVISTRPDMMPEPLLNYLEELQKRCFVLIEYGVESTLDRTLKAVNRGHSYALAADTIRKTAERNIAVGAHLILGLPGESKEEMLLHADRLSQLPLSILKLHQLQIVKGTPMAREYHASPTSFRLFSPEEYATLCLEFLLRLRADIALDRFLSQSPPELLIAPQWNIKNYAFNAILKRELDKMYSEKHAPSKSSSIASY